MTTRPHGSSHDETTRRASGRLRDRLVRHLDYEVEEDFMPKTRVQSPSR
jgi:hypothetical protein